MIYDCFLSHEHEDLGLVEAIARELEDKGLKCWYAPRNVSGRYAKAISEGIRNSKVFVIILNHRSAVSVEVLNEIETAHNVSKNSPYAVIQPVCVEEIDMNLLEYQEIMHYIRRMHFINIFENINPAHIADSIIEKHECLQKSKTERVKSKYIVQDIEDDRLNVQNKLLEKFDDDIYKRILDNYESPKILDVGCGQGDMFVSKIKNRNVQLFLGIDKSSRQVEIAKAKYANENYRFVECDIEEDNFEDKLFEEMQSVDVADFDIINISMVLLHLKNPADILKKLHRYLAYDGTIIIRDIDDGINFAFPDSENAFERIYQICSHDEQSGNRRNGRQIYNNLKNAGFSDIKLERQGLSTATMTYNERDALFNMYFPFTLENAKIMMEQYPWNSEYKNDYLWYNRIFLKIHKQFLEPDFMFSLGFMTYTAKK